MMKKGYYQKIAFLGILLLCLYAFRQYTANIHEDFSEVRFISKPENPVKLFDFDPNHLSAEQWKSLGFSSQQVKTILRYKEIVGGRFISKEQLKKCYSISKEKFDELDFHILLPKTNKEAKSGNFKHHTITVTKKFNPNQYLQSDWIVLGFTERQAQSIMKYKAYLGGSFISKEKFRECFTVSPENYHKLAPYLLLPEKTPTYTQSYSSFKSKKSPEKAHTSFDPNTLDIEGWQSLGFTLNQAKVIVNYRDKNLKGSFKSIDDIQRCFVISPEKYKELLPYIKIISQQELQQEKTDFSTIDLNLITYKQLLEFGLDERSAGSLIGFRKKLGGFVNKEQILDTYNIDKELAQKLVSICPLNTSKILKYTLTDAPEDWLKNHPYFKYSADKIIYYRINNPDDKKIWKLLKVKPEYEAKMKLYLK
ncbi:helix-hairpin-helix domain-containing protein [Chryseobacterium sp.]|uniref:helix-hairpin-helix domain-containing protein n=1 Tax=Chryseobacterium sp. TaxID=1871047 RepID=UPI0025C6888D|nr:helix-hairpin-helix domain-containing protein [Chryseobacterium sp.]